MQRSETRILTTHTGSLPRPRELTRLYALRGRGEATDEAEIQHAGCEAVRTVVRKQRDVGLDIGNNGEQQRDSFFLYLKGRLSGLGGSWERPSRADVDRYPEFKRMWIEQHAARTQVSALGGLPKAISEVRYEHYDSLASYLAALGRALQVEYEAIVRSGLLLQIDAPELALERHITFKDQPVAVFVDFVNEVV